MLKSTQFYNFPLWEIADVQPLLDTVNDGTNKIDETMTTQHANINKNTKSIAELKNNSVAMDENITELSKKVETNTDEILQLTNDLTNQVTAFKRLSNAITSFCHKRL